MRDPWLGCPSCGESDQVQSVPGAYHNGRSVYDGGGPVIGWSATGATVGYGMQTGSIISDTARAIRPPAVANQGGGMLSIALFVLLGVAAVGALTPWRLGYVVLLGVPVLVALRLLVGAVSKKRDAARRRRRLPDVLVLWRQAWYCHRCHGVFFRDGTADVPVRRLLATREFRALLRHRVSAGC